MYHLRHSLKPTRFLLLLSTIFIVHSALGNTLLDVRVGPHKNFDRIVFEFESETVSRVEVKSDQTVEIHFERVTVSPTFSLPPLPPGLTMMKSLKAFKEGDNGLVFEIPLSKGAAPSKLALPGRPWRLALDLASKVTVKDNDQDQESKPDYVPGDLPIPTKLVEEPKDKAPEYIPGDNPIPTKLAEEPKDKAPEYIPGDLPIPTKLVESRPATSDDSFEPAKVHAVLAYFYASVGETKKAENEATLYQKMTGKTLTLTPESGLSVKPPAPQNWLTMPSLPTTGITLLIFVGIAFIGGLLGGFIATKRVPRIHFGGPKSAPKPKKQKAVKAAKAPQDKAEELEDDLELLQKAVELEPSAGKKPSAKDDQPPESELVEAEVPDDSQEKEIKESVMDRRVRRVLELSKQGRNIQAIAQELEMGQDEVKLILDLNQ